MIINLKSGFKDFENDIKHLAVDLNEPSAKSKEAKRSFNRLSDYVLALETEAQLKVATLIQGIDFSKIADDKENKKQATLEEKSKQMISRFVTVDKDASNKLVDLFFNYLKTDSDVLMVNDRTVKQQEIDDLSANDEVLIACCFVVAFIQS